MEKYLPFLIPAVGALLGIIITLVVNTILARMKTDLENKTIDNSYSEGLRDDLIDIMERFQEELKQKGERIVQLEINLETLRQQKDEKTEKLTSRVSILQETVHKLLDENTRLRIELNTKDIAISNLERRIKELENGTLEK